MSSSAPLPLKDRCVLPPCGWQERQRGGGRGEEQCRSVACPTGRAAGGSPETAAGAAAASRHAGPRELAAHRPSCCSPLCRPPAHLVAVHVALARHLARGADYHPRVRQGLDALCGRPGPGGGEAGQ